MLNFLPKTLQTALKGINFNQLYEIRIRKEYPVTINLGGNYVFLRSKGQTLTFTQKEIEEIVLIAGQYSVYSISEELKELFLTTEKGLRIGIAGTVVYEKEKIISVRDINSLCIRLPHEMQGCADRIYSLCFNESLKDSIILAPPGLGKTTILRELIRLIGINQPTLNILVLDERGELSPPLSYKGCDILKFIKKKEGLSYAIRALRPDLIVTDELSKEDYPYIEQAMDSGIIILASAHYRGELSNFKYKIFQNYIFLNNGLGSIDKLYCGDEKIV